jgi:hypothetical protein
MGFISTGNKIGRISDGILIPMRPDRMRAVLWVVATIVVLLSVAEVVTYIKHEREISTVPDEQKIARTLEIIRTSTPTDHKVLKVLFFGQSIIKSGWEKAVIDHWREVYPNTVFVTENRALGGFPASALIRTTDQNIHAFYPDLIVFHDYGNHHFYEKIIRQFRSQTAADVIVQTDHGTAIPDVPCREGLNFSLHPPPGCAGFLWVHQRDWYDEMSYHKIPSFAKKYGLAMEPQRTWWREYLLRTHIDPKSLLIDGLHPNEKGKALMAAFFNRYFDALVASWHGQTEDHVQSIPTNAVTVSNGAESVAFDGSRLELLTSKPLVTWPAVTVDGKPTSEIDGCYLISRASTVGIVPDWPAVRRITLRHDHVAEEWTATLTDLSPDEKTFSFAVQGSVTGADGSGKSTQDFISRSGGLEIDAQDWMVERAFMHTHTPLPMPFVVHWSVKDVCAGTPEVIDLGNGAMQYRYVLVTGITNGPHSVEFRAPYDNLVNAIEFRAYKPELVEPAF